MADFADERQERDHDLFVRLLIEVAQKYLPRYKYWLGDELKELMLQAYELLDKAPQPLKPGIQSQIDMLQYIQDHALPDAEHNLREKILDIDQGLYSDIVDARLYLDEGIHRFDRLVRIVLEYRRGLDGLQT